MTHPKLRITRTQQDNLLSNLRGEVGEVITSWTMLRFLMAEERRFSTDDIANDMKNHNLAFVSRLRHKMSDEIVGRLSELASAKIGRLTFHFASAKLNAFHSEEDSFRRYIERKRFEEKRNYDISHKELPEQWSEHKFISIPYKILLRAVARASQLMKKIDRMTLGPSAPYLWHEMRKRRYSAMNPPAAMYLVLPHLKLSDRVRAEIIMQEMAAGEEVWSEMDTKVNGIHAKVYACKKWGAVLLADHIVCLDQYPLQEVSQINFDVPANAETPPVLGRPILEQQVITAKYRAAAVDNDKIVFAPVQRLHLLEQGSMTELSDFTVNLSPKFRQDMGQINVGDVREFQLTVTVLTGYENLETEPGLADSTSGVSSGSVPIPVEK